MTVQKTRHFLLAYLSKWLCCKQLVHTAERVGQISKERLSTGMTITCKLNVLITRLRTNHLYISSTEIKQFQNSL